MTKTKTSILAMIIAVAVIGLLTSTISFSNSADAQQETIPEWIQNVALFWGQGEISESEFVNALEFLGDEGILKLPAAKSAEAQEISASIGELEQRLETLESTQIKPLDEPTSPGTITTTPMPPVEPDDTSYPYTFSICPSDKVRHFDKVLYKFTPTSEVFLNNVRLACSNGDWVYEDELGVMILEEKHNEINQQINIKNRLVDQLEANDCVMDEEGDAYISGSHPLPWDIEFIDVDYAVVCANKPGVSSSGDSLGYK